MTTRAAETDELAGTPRVGLAESEAGVSFIVEDLGIFQLTVEDWQALWKALGYQLRKRTHLERVN